MLAKFTRACRAWKLRRKYGFTWHAAWHFAEE